MNEVIQHNRDQNDWDIFEGWNYTHTQEPIQLDWNACDDLLAAYSGVINDKYDILHQLLSTWDTTLDNFGGDPTHMNWRRFRPLRLSREEDWSDWFAFLIERSETGIFSQCLFKNHLSNQSAYIKPVNVDREVSHGNYRADVIVRWFNPNDGHTHIEVKVGDTNLEKTFATCEMMRSKYGQIQDQWTNYILLLSQQVSEWEAIDRTVDGEPPVIVLTWEDVSIALRQALRSNENWLWKSWAYCFVGAIEQLIVGYQGHLLKNKPIENVETKIQILQKGLVDDYTNE